jgi:hypothetical protein
LGREAQSDQKYGGGRAMNSPTYYAVYFQDPCGNKFEMVHRLNSCCEGL